MCERERETESDRQKTGAGEMKKRTPLRKKGRESGEKDRGRRKGDERTNRRER